MKSSFLSKVFIFCPFWIWTQQNPIKVEPQSITPQEEIQNHLIEYRKVTDSIIKSDFSNTNALRISAFIDILQFKYPSVTQKIEKALLMDSLKDYKLGRAENFVILSKYHGDIQQNDSAIYFGKKAFDISRSISSKNAGRHLKNLYVAYANRNMKDSIIRIIKRALSFSREARDSLTILELLKIEENLLKKYSEDKTNVEKLHQYGIKTNNEFIVAVSDGRKGNVLMRNRDSLRIAAKYLDLAITFFRNSENLFLLNTIYPSRAYVASLINDKNDKPIHYYKKQYEMLKNTGTSLEDMTFYNIANEYVKEGKIDKAKTTFEEIIKLSKEREIQKLLIGLSHENLSKIYEDKKQYKKALEEYKGLYAVENEIYSTQIAEQVNKFKIQFESSEKEKENLQLKNDYADQALKTQKATTQNWIFGLLSAIALLSLLLFVRYAKSRKKRILYNSQLNVIKAKQNEHEEIGAELHDNVAKELEGIAMNLQKEGNDKIADEVTIIKDSIRSLSKELSVISFEESTFKEQVITIAANYQTEKLNVEIDGLDDIAWTTIANPIKYNLFLVIREAISNSSNHSKAKNLNISFKKNKKDVSISITDDGIGFDKNTISYGRGFRNMKIRVNDINGTLKITSKTSNGTKILVQLALV